MRAALVALALLACGRGSDGELGGGGSNLPVSGVGPFRKLVDYDFSTPLEEPFVVTLPGVDLEGPAALADGARVRIYYARGGAIWRSDLPATFRELPGEPAMVLAAAEAWEGGALRSPAIVDDGDRVILYYQGSGGVGRAESTDRGESFTTTGLVLEGATAPAALRVGDRWFLYHGRVGEPGIFVATSDDGEAWTPRATPVLAEGAAPAVVGGLTATGRLRVVLYYDRPGESGATAIGVAASGDGETFEIDEDAAMDPASPSERGAAVLATPARVLLFFNQDASGKLAIALATSP